jgi:hypothetical protein
MELWLIVVAIVWLVGPLVWNVYDYRIAPLFIPAAEIEAEARALGERYGDIAAEVALAEADHDLRYCHLRRAGRWRRVANACTK